MTKYDKGKCVKVDVSKEGYYPQVEVVAMNENHTLDFELTVNPTHKIDYNEPTPSSTITTNPANANKTETLLSNLVGLSLENIEEGSTIKFTIADDSNLMTNRESFLKTI